MTINLVYLGSIDLTFKKKINEWLEPVRDNHDFNFGLTTFPKCLSSLFNIWVLLMNV